ncbi:hypothetical protein LNW71_22775 [Streptomyces sp. RKAG290]|nr:hypothetical protein [Streptomyces sp. RKAG290]MCM2414281.1 hypothetical protein [Streptomyces sp. RKAG290]
MTEGMSGGGGAPGGNTGGHAQLSASGLTKLPEPVRRMYEQAVSDGVHQVFLYTLGIAAAAFLSAWFIKPRPQPAAVAASAADDQKIAAG